MVSQVPAHLHGTAYVVYMLCFTHMVHKDADLTDCYYCLHYSSC